MMAASYTGRGSGETAPRASSPGGAHSCGALAVLAVVVICLSASAAVAASGWVLWVEGVGRACDDTVRLARMGHCQRRYQRK